MKPAKSLAFMLFLTAGISTVFAAETQDSTAQKKTEKAAKKPAKQKSAKPKKEVKAVPLEEAIKIATTPTLAQKRARRLEQKKKYTAKNKDKIKILMLGDSITQQWEDKHATEAYQKYIVPYNVLNLGCNGDRTENTLWIVEKSGILEMIKPNLVVLLIGTNNRNHHLSTVAGIKRIVEQVRQRYPETPILLYAIFPRGGNNKNRLRIENEKVNAEIEKLCNGKDIIWVDIRKKFVSPEGLLNRELLPDTLHPKTSKGYAVWGESLKPYFEKYGK